MGGRSSQVNVEAPMPSDTFHRGNREFFLGRIVQIHTLRVDRWHLWARHVIFLGSNVYIYIFTSMSSYNFSKGGIFPGNLMQFE